jgi:hypothetical protein
MRVEFFYGMAFALDVGKSSTHSSPFLLSSPNRLPDISGIVSHFVT